MKIGFLTPEYPHERTTASGGIGTSIRNLCYALKNAGHEPSVHVYGQPADTNFNDDGIEIYTLKSKKFRGISWLLLRLKIQNHINRLYASGKLDIVEAPDWTGVTSFVKVNCPLVIRLHGSDTYFGNLENRSLKPVNRFHERLALQSADAVVSVSKFTADKTREIFRLTREISVIPNCIDAEKFAAENNVGTGEKILYFGTLIRKKGLLELPHIFNLVVQARPDATLVLVGKDSPDALTGSDSTWKLMKPLFSDAAFARVQYVGSVPYSKIKSFIDEADVCVSPTFAEALPLSWIEAMAMGKAIVASDIGWAPEIIENGQSGFLVDPLDHDMFARRIVSLLVDVDLRLRMSAEARNRVMNVFDGKIVSQRNISFYSRVIQKFIKA